MLVSALGARTYRLSKWHSPLILIIEERLNQWNSVAGRLKKGFEPEVFEVDILSDSEKSQILEALAKYDALGRLTGLDRSVQLEHFTQVAQDDLLVALRELTTEGRFDEIVRDEYRKIPTTLGQTAYAYASAVGQIDLYIRYPTLMRILDCDVDALRNSVFGPTEGVLVTGEVTGRSRHTHGYRVRVRHPVVASIVFALAAPTDEQKVILINTLIAHLDPGFLDDRSLLSEIAHHRELVGTLAHDSNKRAVYDVLLEKLPHDPYVYQHRSILERELGDTDAAVKFAREAMQKAPGNGVIGNSLGLALEAAARKEPQVVRRNVLLSEANALFDKGIRDCPRDPYSYLGKVYVLRQQAAGPVSGPQRAVLRAEVLAMLETAREETMNSSVIEREYAVEQAALGNDADAISILETAMARQPANDRIRGLLVRYLMKGGQDDRALGIAVDGVKYNPTSWRLLRDVARLRANRGDELSAVRMQYEAAIRNNRKDVGLQVELGSYLFMKGEYAAAEPVFRQANDAAQSGAEKHEIRQWWTDNEGKRREFDGRVSRLAGAGAFAMAIPENFEAYFWRGNTLTASLIAGDDVQFCVAFTCRGARAQITRVVRSQLEERRRTN